MSRPDFTDPKNTPHGFYGDQGDALLMRTCESCGFATYSRDEWWYHRFEECAGEGERKADSDAAFVQALTSARGPS